MEYKIGDKVQVKEDLCSGHIYGGIYATHTMASLKGKVITISEVHFNNKYKVSGYDYIFSEEMFQDHINESFTRKGNDEKMIDNRKMMIRIKYPDFTIVNYKVCEHDGVFTTVVEFEASNGVRIKEHAVLCKDDSFELEKAIEVCVMKYLFGAERYKFIIREANRQVRTIDKNKVMAEKEAAKAKEVAERKKAKAKKRKEKYLNKMREERVEDLKKAFVAALTEITSGVAIGKLEKCENDGCCLSGECSDDLK